MCELSRLASSTSLRILYVQATPDGKTLLTESAQALDPKFSDLDAKRKSFARSEPYQG
jgi:hypothetical protein